MMSGKPNTFWKKKPV